MRASLRRRPEDSSELGESSAAVQWLKEHDIEVLRVGRRAFSVEAEPEVLSSALEAAIEPDKALVLTIEPSGSPLGEWFDLLEVTPLPRYFSQIR